MFLWWALLCIQLLRGHDSYCIKAEEGTQTACTGTTSVVVSQTKPPKAQQADTASVVHYTCSTPLTGPTVVEEHQSSYGDSLQCRVGSLEVFLHEAQQEDSRILWTMWEALDKSAKSAISKTMELMEPMGRMGESPKGPTKRIVCEAKKYIQTQKTQRRKRWKQGWIQERKRAGPWTAFLLAFTFCELPATNEFYTVGWRDFWNRSVTLPVVATGEHSTILHAGRTSGGSYQSICFQRADAERRARTGGQGCTTKLEEHHEGAPLSYVHVRTSEEISCRDSRIPQTTSSGLDPASPRRNCFVEQTTTAIHGAPSDAFRTGRTCNPRNTSGDKGDPGVEQQGSRCLGNSSSAYCTRSLGQQHGGSQEGTGERGAQNATTQGVVGLRTSYRGRCEGKGVQGRHHSRGFRQRARIAYTKTTQIHRPYWYLVKDGRIVSCLKVNGRCKGHRKVCFDVVEAYDQGHHAAGHVLAFIPLPAFESTAIHHPAQCVDVCHGSHKAPQVDRADRAAVPTMQSRPNADLVQDFDDNLPLTSSSEDESGAPCRHIPPPDWRNSAELGRAHADRALFSRANGHLVVKLTTWLVDHGRHNQYQDSRPLTIRPQILSLLNQKLRKLWRDQVGRRDIITYVLVTPTPAALADEDRTLHVIVEKNKPPRTEWKAILFTLRAIEGGVPQEADRRAVLVHQVITREGLCESLGIGCNPVHLMVPTGRRQGWLQAREERIVTSGLHIPIWWDLRRRIETLQEEQTSLFQLTRASDQLWQARLDPEPGRPIDINEGSHHDQHLPVQHAPSRSSLHPGPGQE